MALSLLRTGGDSRAASALKQLIKEVPVDAMPAAQDLLPRLAEALGIPPDRRAARIRTALQLAGHAVAGAGACGASVHPWSDPAYPKLLREIHDPPIVLWLRGDARALVEPAVAVVGSRHATPAGLAMARRLGRELAAAGITVVSGLARGVDGAAHEGALEAHGRSIAVLGSGVDVIYPAEHRSLAEGVLGRGLVMSELPPGTPPLPSHFPLRNRIISGLVRAVVVIEAGEKSGSLITARQALEQGRDVLAVPGNAVSGRYRGSHALIKDGAPLVETVEDVLHELRWGAIPGTIGNARAKPLDLSKLEKQMAIGESYRLDELLDRTGLTAAAVLAELGSLEVGGRIGRVAGGGFVRLDNSDIGGGDG